MASLDITALSDARDRLISVAIDHFSVDPDVLGLFVSGSLAAGSSDAYSDIDLRVVVRHERHSWFVEHRRDFPKQWPGFLFNEWVAGARHCVSHFSPFNKIDIFYLDAAALKPSPWYRLPVIIHHDPEKVVAGLVDHSKWLNFEITADDIDFSISKGLAAAHETYRRAKRGELFYSQTLLDELRQHIMQSDDWLNGRTPETTILAKFDRRSSPDVRQVLAGSYCEYDADMILGALSRLLVVYRDQVMRLHEGFKLSRPLKNDLAALAACWA
ncbi:hypothetical protein EN837_03565 [bacterium M00.F.Ca.ET.194.01.1.1]|uniref:hypothetical protein n=1 Tax=Agrobacterium pusense TaxID=648995 RepID=UPI0010925FD3|nr:hypothetical protein [Agrobacterium pusense]TGR72435.1 hypothetical protein EN837_03565 [bacterium M00.F.Ca.ET.194.01.1.1]TGS57336.1 hypothetical protein EN822_03565 [bacterium M00.F.Ca.ET.179.01.1.1]TGV50267.1 hypothetical protein EN811_03565 [bacterium M00.F.Ca.ET.168.01.1.1]